MVRGLESSTARGHGGGNWRLRAHGHKDMRERDHAIGIGGRHFAERGERDGVVIRVIILFFLFLGLCMCM